MSIRNRREKRWGERNIGGLAWGCLFGIVAWCVLILVAVLIYRASK